jgi:hypothetical protein
MSTGPAVWGFAQLHHSLGECYPVGNLGAVGSCGPAPEAGDQASDRLGAGGADRRHQNEAGGSVHHSSGHLQCHLGLTERLCSPEPGGGVTAGGVRSLVGDMSRQGEHPGGSALPSGGVSPGLLGRGRIGSWRG